MSKNSKNTNKNVKNRQNTDQNVKKSTNWRKIVENR